MGFRGETVVPAVRGLGLTVRLQCGTVRTVPHTPSFAGCYKLARLAGTRLMLGTLDEELAERGKARA